MEDFLSTMFGIGFFILLLIGAAFVLRYLLRYLICGFRETWDFAGKMGPIGHGLLIAGWIFFLPVALVVTIITGWGASKNDLNSARGELPDQYDHVLNMGHTVVSDELSLYQIELYPGGTVSLPPGEWVILREGDFSKSYGSVFMKALLDGDMEFVSTYSEQKPSYVWIIDKKEPPNFLQITVTDARSSTRVTQTNLLETKKYLRQYHSKDTVLESYCLDLRQLNLQGWSDESLVEEKRYNHRGYRRQSYCISIQDRPFTTVCSTTCLQEVADRYITLTLEMARTYRRLEGDYENKIEG